jgi:hypothetical protein
VCKRPGRGGEKITEAALPHRLAARLPRAARDTFGQSAARQSALARPVQ